MKTLGRYQFSQALIQETLADEPSTTRKVRLHARIAGALEELYGEDAEAHAAELAHHFGEEVTVTGPYKLVQYSPGFSSRNAEKSSQDVSCKLRQVLRGLT